MLPPISLRPNPKWALRWIVQAQFGKPCWPPSYLEEVGKAYGNVDQKKKSFEESILTIPCISIDTQPLKSAEGILQGSQIPQEGKPSSHAHELAKHTYIIYAELGAQVGDSIHFKSLSLAYLLTQVLRILVV